MTHLDLCSGIGGFHIAAEWAGFETVGFSEVEPYCCKLLAQHWPSIKNYGDLRTADFSGLRGTITVLSAGVPCQPASLAGKRRGDKDDRWLWPAVLDVVGAVQPAWAIFENPSGILSLPEFETVLLRLADLGYEVRAFSVPANAVGADHLRQRVFVVANCARQLPHGSGRSRDGRYEFADSSETLADAMRSRGWQESGSAPSDEIADERWPSQDGHQSASSSETLADADSAQRRTAQSGGNEYNGQETGRRQSSDQYQGVCDTDVANAEGAGLEEHESRQNGYQRAAALGSSGPGGFRLTQPPLCRRTDGIQNRSHRLKALGNAVVPQQAWPFFHAIAQTEMSYSSGTN